MQSSPDSQSEGERGVVLPFPAVVPPMVAFRGTILVGAQQALRSLGLLDDYRAAIADDAREALLALSATTWVPMDVSLAHFAAVEALELTDEVQIELGRLMGARVRGVLVSGVSATLRAAGFSPWLLLGRSDTMLGLLARGSAMEVRKLGPKDASVEIRGAPMWDSRFFQLALLGIIDVTFDLAGAKKHYVRLAGVRGATQSVRYTLQWV